MEDLGDVDHEIGSFFRLHFDRCSLEVVEIDDAEAILLVLVRAFCKFDYLRMF